MNNGFTGKVLWVDLTRGAITPQTIPSEVYENFLAGTGLAAYLLYQAIPAHADPLGPENVLGFVPGLLTSTGALFTGRWMVVGKSPLTGTWGEANCGGTFSHAIKRCGYDGIFITGASPHPVTLIVDDAHAELQDATAFWGQDTLATETALKKSFPNRASSVACIGPAGEKLSLISGICNDSGRLAARSGMGAVMGAKRLKAVLALGSQKVKVHDSTEISRLDKKLQAWVNFKLPFPRAALTRHLGTLIGKLPVQMAQDGVLYKSLLQKWGTISMNQMSVEMGDSPIQNWRGSNRSFAPRLSASVDPDRIIAHQKTHYHCRACPLGCGGLADYQGQTVHKPEYETVNAFGGLLLNQDLESIWAINERLNRAGMDTISAGATIAFAIECFENGMITRHDTGGLELAWGNSAAILALVDLMVTRQGLGDLLADGSRRAAERLGHGSEQYAVHAGGQELAMHDGRNDPGFSLHAVVEASPGRHTQGSQLYYEMFQLWTRVKDLPRVPRFYRKKSKYQPTPSKAIQAVACSRFSQVMNGAGLCLFGAFIGVSRLPIFEWLNAATGWNKTPEAYMEIGARIQALKQLFNAREGIPLRHTINPRALGLPPQSEGVNQGASLDMDAMVRNYWAASEWDPETGMPTPECLKRLHLDSLSGLPE